VLALESGDHDRATEDEAEEQDEHDRAQRDVEQELRRAPDVDEVSLDHLPRVAEPPGGAHARLSAGSGASSAGRPVIDRKTSSSVGRLKPMSSTFTSAA